MITPAAPEKKNMIRLNIQKQVMYDNTISVFSSI